MTLLGKAYGALRALLSRRKLETELDDEVRLHLDLETAANVRRGMSAEEARRAALVIFGGVDQAKEGCRDARGGRFLEVLMQDVRYGLRGLRRAPFHAPAGLTLGRGSAQHQRLQHRRRILSPSPTRGARRVGCAAAGCPVPAPPMGLSPLESETTADERSFAIVSSTDGFTCSAAARRGRVRTGVVRHLSTCCR